MPDIRATRIKTKLTDKVQGWTKFQSWPAEFGPAGLVLVVAVVLSVFRIELQYVAGAALVIYAERLAHKRVAPIHNYKRPEESRPVREMVAAMGDKKAAELDFDMFA